MARLFEVAAQIVRERRASTVDFDRETAVENANTIQQAFSLLFQKSYLRFSVARFEELCTKQTLVCDMTHDCQQPVTHIDAKGWVYCTTHGIERKSAQRCRKLTARERRQLEAGKPLARY